MMEIDYVEKITEIRSQVRNCLLQIISYAEKMKNKVYAGNSRRMKKYQPTQDCVYVLRDNIDYMLKENDLFPLPEQDLSDFYIFIYEKVFYEAPWIHLRNIYPIFKNSGLNPLSKLGLIEWLKYKIDRETLLKAKESGQSDYLQAQQKIVGHGGSKTQKKHTLKHKRKSKKNLKKSKKSKKNVKKSKK
jgi:hypothetical protein